MQPPEDGPRANWTGAGPRRRERGLQRQRSVWSLRVVDAGELGQDRAQVRLVDYDDMVQALAAQRADEPLGDRVRAGRPDRGEHGLDAESPGAADEVAAVDAV